MLSALPTPQLSPIANEVPEGTQDHLRICACLIARAAGKVAHRDLPNAVSRPFGPGQELGVNHRT